jgi:hypothetical protein
MRKRKFLIGALAAAVAVSVTGIAYSAQTQTAAMSVAPKKLPKKKRKNVKLFVHVSTKDTTSPTGVPSPATRARVHIDNAFLIRPGVAGRCTQSQIADSPNTATARARCGRALVGTGSAIVLSPSGDPASPNAFGGVVSAFNSTPQGGKPTLILYTYIEALNFGQPLIGVLKKSGAGRDFGKVLDVTIPPLTGGAALVDFRVKLGKPVKPPYIKANCSDKNRRLNIKALFNYANGTALTARASQRCKVLRRRR